MTAPLAPGPDGTPVPAGVRLIRMANEPKLANLNAVAQERVRAGKALPAFFELSSEDKAQPVPRLSVWVEGLTTAQQAWVLVGAVPTRNWVVLLNADAVRAAETGTEPKLDVHWERATMLTPAGERVLEMRPGWDGHAGITNLDCGNKPHRAALRLYLADIAEMRVLTVEDLTATDGGSDDPSHRVK